LRFRLEGLGFRIQSYRANALIRARRAHPVHLGRVEGLGFRVQGPGLRVQGSGFRVEGSGLRVQGSPRKRG
jgi:hypothetical protein